MSLPPLASTNQKSEDVLPEVVTFKRKRSHRQISDKVASLALVETYQKPTLNRNMSVKASMSKPPIAPPSTNLRSSYEQNIFTDKSVDIMADRTKEIVEHSHALLDHAKLL